MKNTADSNSLQFAITPGTGYISANPDQSSYANIVVTVENTGTESVLVNSIAITLPVALAPYGSLNSITPVAGTPDVWNFGPSGINPGEFDATPVMGNYVTINPNDIYQFTLQMVTLVSTISQPAADVITAVIFEDGSSFSVPLNVDIALAVAAIVSFNAEPSNINPGQTATLNWQCEKIDYCIISPIDDSRRHASGRYQVSPAATTIYTLYAYGDGVILSAQWAVSVDNPQIVKFGGLDGQTSVNCGSNITLVWECNQFTESIALVDNTGVAIPNLITGGNTPQQGSVTVGPILEPTTFTFTAYGNTNQNFDQRNPTINMNDVVYSLGADPNSGIWVRDAVTLTWNIESASAVSLSPSVPNGPSLQNLSNSVEIYPAQNVTYILSVSGFINNSPVSRTFPVSLTVEPVTINSFSTTPAIINRDTEPNECSLAWNTQAQIVSIDNGVGNQQPVGSCVLNAPANGTIYTLTAGTTGNPNLITQTTEIFNSYGPYTFTSFNADQTIITGVDFVVPDAGAMSVLLQGFGGGYQATFTGVVAVGTPPPSYAALAVYLNGETEQSYFIILAWPPVATPVAFQWADANNQTGTITLAPLPAGALEQFLR